MNEMLPEERQIVKALNPWLRLSSPSFCDRDQHQSLYIKSLLRNNSESTKGKKNGRERGSEWGSQLCMYHYSYLKQYFLFPSCLYSLYSFL